MPGQELAPSKVTSAGHHPGVNFQGSRPPAPVPRRTLGVVRLQNALDRHTTWQAERAGRPCTGHNLQHRTWQS